VSPPSHIPFNKPFITGREMVYLQRCVDDAAIGGDGAFTRACARWLEQRFGAARVLMTPSCTAALEMAVQLLDVGPGDEVILPSFTFVSTANAVVRAGARPVFVDIRPDTLNLDESLIQAALTPRTRAIVPVHYAGVACDMDRIAALAARRDVAVIEDAAQGVNAFYKGRPLGTIGALGAYSFHDTKNYVCGEGGALVVNKSSLIERAEIIREKGTNRSQFRRGEVDKYTWVDVGSSYIPSEVSCAFLLAQLEAMDEITARRRAIGDNYRQRLSFLAERGRLQLPQPPPECETNHHAFVMLLPDAATRTALMAYLERSGISAAFHYVPLHSAPMGRKFGFKPDDLPVTESVSARLLRLPFFPGLTNEQQDRIIDAVTKFFNLGYSAAHEGR
jgi:dTDP-4-amino-4,6-dideoxygalactose transaminase